MVIILFVANIHNNSLGSCTPVEDWDDGIALVREIAEEKMGRELNAEEMDALANEGQITNEDDIDNVWCVSLGTLDGE